MRTSSGVVASATTSREAFEPTSIAANFGIAASYQKTGQAG
jgi:hypothetical protein